MEAILGVTRVARVTGLDKAGHVGGVEVACAVRPSGHVLQVSNGKGATWEKARAGAVAEAAELWAAERPRGLVYGTLRELANAWEPSAVVSPALWSPDLRIAWVRGRELRSRREVFVPAQAIFCPARGRPPLGPAVCRWTSSGMGAHGSRDRALRHALLEACERHQLASALPRGWTPRAIATRMIDASRIPLWSRLRDARLLAYVFDLSDRLPVAAALLVDLEEGPVPVTAGYCCALRPEEAIAGAILEAAQSRITDVHGAREDVEPQDPGSTAALRAACRRARPARSIRDMPSARGIHLPVPEIAVVQLCSEPLHVVKVHAPALRVPEFL